MAEEYPFVKQGDFSEIIGGNKIVASSIGFKREAVLLTVRPEYEKAAFGREERKGFATFPFSKARHGYPATFVRFDGREALQETELAEVEVAFPYVQSLPDGGILLVGARCHYRNGNPETNAAVFSPEGNLQHRFVLGDGINDVQSTSEGMIWVSYFDEGVFGNYGWSQPLGAPGLVCFDSTGTVVWNFTSPAGFDQICDCYALNVAESAVWACYYTEFPLVRIDQQKRIRAWDNKVHGASAIAVDERRAPRALLWGGYGDERCRCIVQDLGSEALLHSRELALRFPDAGDLVEARVVGRGSILHAFVQNAWFSFDLAQLP